MKDTKQFFYFQRSSFIDQLNSHYKVLFLSQKEGRRITRSINNLVAKRMGPCKVNLHESSNLTASISKKLRKIASMHQFFFISQQNFPCAQIFKSFLRNLYSFNFLDAKKIIKLSGITLLHRCNLSVQLLKATTSNKYKNMFPSSITKAVFKMQLQHCA